MCRAIYEALQTLREPETTTLDNGRTLTLCVSDLDEVRNYDRLWGKHITAASAATAVATAALKDAGYDEGPITDTEDSPSYLNDLVPYEMNYEEEKGAKGKGKHGGR